MCLGAPEAHPLKEKEITMHAHANCGIFHTLSTFALSRFLHTLTFILPNMGLFNKKKKREIGKLTGKKTIKKWSQNLQSVPMLWLTMVVLEKKELGVSSFKKPSVRELLQTALSNARFTGSTCESFASPEIGYI